VLILDGHGYVRACGESLAARLGRDGRELVAQPAWALLPGWTPFRAMSADQKLRLSSLHEETVRLSCEAIHLPGETWFVVDVYRPADAAEAGPAEAIMVTDRHGEIRYVNRAFEAMSGFTGAELAGLTPAVLKSGAHPPRVYRELWQTILAGGSWRGVLANRQKNGQVFHEVKVIRPVFDARRQLKLFISSGRDLEQWRARVEPLLRSREALSSGAA
jgi:PAS domain S-box-containing protein